MLGLLGGFAQAQSAFGYPYLQNFEPKQYNADPRNWCLIQDPRGVMYVGNYQGLLEFDGVRWRLIPMEAGFEVRSLALDEKGRLFIGCIGDFGYLKSSEHYEPRYVSLKNLVPEDARTFETVWAVLPTSQGIYFNTNKYLFRYHDGRMSVIRPKKTFSFNGVFSLHGRVYVGDNGRGFREVQGDALVPSSMGQDLPRAPLEAVLALSRDRALVHCKGHGYFLMDQDKVKPFQTPLQGFLEKNEVYDCLEFENGDLAFATIQGGVVVTDQGGKLRYLLNEKSAQTLSDSTTQLWVDQEKGLWIGWTMGLSRAAVQRPVTRFSSAAGLSSNAWSVLKHQGRLYAGNDMNVYRLQEAKLQDARGEFFKPLDAYFPECRQLDGVDGRILAAGYKGLMEIKGDKGRPLEQTFRSPAISFQKSVVHSERIWVTSNDGLNAFRRAKDTWINEGAVPGLHDYLTSLSQLPNGVIWCGTEQA